MNNFSFVCLILSVGVLMGFTLPDMYRHRHGELVAFISEEFKEAVKKAGVTLINYRDLIIKEGLDDMERRD